MDEELERIKLRKLRELMRGERALDKPLVLDSRNFDEVVRRNPLVLVDFWAEWCAPCLMLAPIIEELARKYSGRVVFAKLNVDQNPSIAARYKIMSIPTLILFKNGQPVDMMIGVHPKPMIEEMLKKHL